MTKFKTPAKRWERSSTPANDDCLPMFFRSFFLDQILFKIVHTSMMNRLLLFAIISNRLSTVLHIRNFFIEMLFTYVSIFMYIPFLYIRSFILIRSLALSSSFKLHSPTLFVSSVNTHTHTHQSKSIESIWKGKEPTKSNTHIHRTQRKEIRSSCLYLKGILFYFDIENAVAIQSHFIFTFCRFGVLFH